MMQNRILFTGFKKANEHDTSASLELLKELNDKEKFLFTNDYDSIDREIDKILEEHWDKIIMFGQKPALTRLSIERCASCDDTVLSTTWDLDGMCESLQKWGIDFKFSDNPGNYYCNHAYYQMLKQVADNGLDAKVLFIHIPYVDRFRQFGRVVEFLNNIEEEI